MMIAKIGQVSNLFGQPLYSRGPKVLTVMQRYEPFSVKNSALIKMAYPWARGAEHKRICTLINRYVAQSSDNEQSAIEYLKGRIFGLTGKI